MKHHRLRNLAPNLWVVDSTFHVWCLKGSTRMTIVRLGDGALWVHSPVRLSDDLRQEIAALGRVAYVVAPNNMHYLYFEEFLEAFPEAQGFVAHSLVEKHPAYGKYRGVEALIEVTGGEINQLEVSGHTLGETVFLHKPSGTLIVTDLLYNIQAHSLWFEKLVMRIFGAYGKPSIPAYHRVAIKNSEQLRASVDEVAKWPVERIIMAHGDVIVGRSAGRMFRSCWERMVAGDGEPE